MDGWMRMRMMMRMRRRMMMMMMHLYQNLRYKKWIEMVGSGNLSWPYY